MFIIIHDNVEEYVRLNSLIAEFNQHQLAIDTLKEIAKLARADANQRIDDWLQRSIAPEQKILDQLSPLIQDAVKRLTDGSDKKSVSLPNGKAGFHSAPKTFIFNGARADASNSALVDALAKANSEFISYAPKLDWKSMAKGLHIVNDTVCDKNGEVIDGLTLEVKPDQFYVKEAKSDD